MDEKMDQFNNDNKITVCHVLNRLDIGGMENGVVNICNQINRERFIPTICCLNALGPMADRLSPDVDLTNMAFPMGYQLTAILTLAKYFRSSKIDIVHTHAWGAGSFYGILAAKLARVPVVVNGEHGSFFLKPHQIILQRFLSSLCNANLSVSESLKIKINEFLGIPAEKIRVIRNGVDTDTFTGDYPREEVLKKLNDQGYQLDSNSFYIITVGSLKVEKGQIFLLKAFRQLKMQQVDSVRVIVVGDGPDRTMLSDYVMSNGLWEHVYFVGNRPDIPELLSVADLFVSTSVPKHEGLSNVMLEAMSSGLPVISSVSVGTSELVKDGFNGYIFQENDVQGLASKIEMLVSDRFLLQELSKNAKKFIRNNFSLPKMINEYEELYLYLLSCN